MHYLAPDGRHCEILPVAGRYLVTGREPHFVSAEECEAMLPQPERRTAERRRDRFGGRRHWDVTTVAKDIALARTVALLAESSAMLDMVRRRAA